MDEFCHFLSNRKFLMAAESYVPDSKLLSENLRAYWQQGSMFQTQNMIEDSVS